MHRSYHGIAGIVAGSNSIEVELFISLISSIICSLLTVLPVSQKCSCLFAPLNTTCLPFSLIILFHSYLSKATLQASKSIFLHCHRLGKDHLYRFGCQIPRQNLSTLNSKNADSLMGRIPLNPHPKPVGIIGVTVSMALMDSTISLPLES